MGTTFEASLRRSSFCPLQSKMGKIRTKTVKKAARQIVEKYYDRLCLDFQVNKRVCDDVAEIGSKRLRNQVAGYVTRLMKRVERCPRGVKGISLKLQEEQREKRLDFVPDVSALEVSSLKIDIHTRNMLKKMGMGNLSNLKLEDKRESSAVRRGPTGSRRGRGGFRR